MEGKLKTHGWILFFIKFQNYPIQKYWIHQFNILLHSLYFVSQLPVAFYCGSQVFHTDPTLLYPIPPCIIPLVLLMNFNLKSIPQIFKWIQVRRLTWIQLTVLIPLFSNRSFVSFVICLGSLSCGITKIRPCPKEVAGFWRFFSRISLYMIPFILPWINCISPVPLDEKHPHIIKKPHPNLTVGMVLCFTKAGPIFHQTLVAVFLPNSSNFVSFGQIPFSQNCIFFFS